ncbi:Alpha/Beta hydrolase protein [Podospora didyma]|uniref:Alpha/Beta hydrolase protein n=1 Tax=Podospora didyma TaxID=330526 RepID=A0AAE0U0U5_9PEZI|nr:Alpha/Beta hydrolase protein [Podospora didyma]
MSPFVVGPEAGVGHTHTVILLHGRDSDAREFGNEFLECSATTSTPTGKNSLPDLFPAVRWVFPQARHCQSQRFDTQMSQWFDMWTTENPQERSELQRPGLSWSVDHLRALIREEEVRVPRERIVLAGISQGFAAVLATFLADGKGGFAGLAGFCSWFPLVDQVTSPMTTPQVVPLHERLAAVQQLFLHDGGDGANTQPESLPASSQLTVTTTLIHLQHSRDDEVIAIENGERMRDVLEQLGFGDVQWREYEDGGHWFNEPQGVDDFFEFLERVW